VPVARGQIAKAVACETPEFDLQIALVSPAWCGARGIIGLGACPWHRAWGGQPL